MDVSFDFQRISGLAAAGQFWDLAGAWYLARAFVFSGNGLIRKQAGTYWGKSIPQIIALCEQRYDSQFGIGHLVIGALLQLASALGVSISIGLSFLSICPMICALNWYLRNRERNIAIACIRAGLEKPQSYEIMKAYFASPILFDRCIRIVFLNDIKPALIMRTLSFIGRINYTSKVESERKINDCASQISRWLSIADERGLINSIIDDLRSNRQSVLSVNETNAIDQLINSLATHKASDV